MLSGIAVNWNFFASDCGPCYPFHSQVQKSTFSQQSEVVRIGSVINFHLSKLWKAKFFTLCDVILLVQLQGKLDLDHSWEWKGYARISFPLWGCWLWSIFNNEWPIICSFSWFDSISSYMQAHRHEHSCWNACYDILNSLLFHYKM